jgi:hypothetical protein
VASRPGSATGAALVAAVAHLSEDEDDGGYHSEAEISAMEGAGSAIPMHVPWQPGSSCGPPSSCMRPGSLAPAVQPSACTCEHACCVLGFQLHGCNAVSECDCQACTALVAVPLACRQGRTTCLHASD